MTTWLLSLLWLQRRSARIPPQSLLRWPYYIWHFWIKFSDRESSKNKTGEINCSGDCGLGSEWTWVFRPQDLCPRALGTCGEVDSRMKHGWESDRYSGMPGWVQAPPPVWDRVTSPLGVIHCCVYYLLNAVFLRDYSDWTEQEKYAQRQSIRINWGRNIRQGLRSQGSWLYEENWTCYQAWGPELNTQNLHDRKKEMVPASVLCDTCTHTLKK